MKRIFNVFIIVMVMLMLLSGCAGGDIIEETTAESVLESIVETTKEDTMKEQTNTNKEPWIMKNVGGVSVREVSIDIAGDGEAIEIVQLSDIHFNAINDQDRAENHELVIGSYNDEKLWLKDGASLGNLQRCLNYAKNADQIVITGDLISYLSYGNLELVKKYIFDPYPDVMACLGNHDPLRSWKASVDEKATLEERLKILEDNWIHDIYYSSKVIDERVMVIQMDNGLKSEYGVSEAFWDRQIEPLRNDLATAREKGYTVLLFYHVPISTGNVKYYSTQPIGSRGNVANFYTGNIVSKYSTGASKTIYDMIVSNGDIIKGAFCGHMHADYYSEITATGAGGGEYIIPQYILTALPYDSGHALKITLK